MRAIPTIWQSKRSERYKGNIRLPREALSMDQVGLIIDEKFLNLFYLYCFLLKSYNFFTYVWIYVPLFNLRL